MDFYNLLICFYSNIHKIIHSKIQIYNLCYHFTLSITNKKKPDCFAYDKYEKQSGLININKLIEISLSKSQ